MPRKKKNTEAQQQEILNSPVRLDGVGEDPAVRDLAKIPEMTNEQALDVAVALQQILRGQQTQGEELAKIRAEMVRMDKAAKKWEEDRVKFVEEVERRASKYELAAAEKEKLLAKEAGHLQELVREAMAQAAVDKMRFDQILAAEPKETIVSPGELLMVNESGAQMAKLVPEEIRIKHRVWVLEPGVPVEVPKSVADFVRSKRRQARETSERQAALQRNLESNELDREFARINKEYNSPTQERLVIPFKE